MRKFHSLNMNSVYAVRIMHEKKLIEEHYSPEFARCTVTWNNNKACLVCHVHYSLEGEDIHFRILYEGHSSPRAWIVSPKIEDPQHIYPEDKDLCLYDPLTDEWTEKSNIYNTFIPWCQQWIVFQRLYEQTGTWQHPERHPSSTK